MSLLDNIKSWVWQLWERATNAISNVINKGGEILDEWAANVASNIWEFFGYDWDTVYQKAKENPFTKQVKEDWDNTIASEVVEDTAESVKKFSVNIVDKFKEWLNNNPVIQTGAGLVDFLSPKIKQANDWLAEAGIASLQNYWNISPLSMIRVAMARRGGNDISDDTKEWATVKSLQDTLPWIINTIWLGIDVTRVSDDTEYTTRTPAQQEVAVAISGTQDKIDWTQFYRDSGRDVERVNNEFANLSNYNDENIQKVAEEMSIWQWISIEDATQELQKERAKVFQSIFSESATAELTQEDMSAISNAAKNYVAEYEQANVDYRPIFEKEDIEYYKRFYPTTWEAKVAEKEKEKARRQEIGETWIDAFPEFARRLEEIKWDINVPYSERVIATENAGRLINAYSAMKLDNDNFILTLSNMSKAAGVSETDIQAIENKVNQYGKNYTYYMERVALNFIDTKDNNVAQDLADVDYIKNIVNPAMSDTDTLTIKWTRLTKADIQAIADWTYQWKDWSSYPPGYADKLRRDIAAQVVVEQMTQPLRTITVNGKENEIKLEQRHVGTNSFGMEWISYIQAQIKDVVRSQAKNNIYYNLWYDLFGWIADVYLWTAQTLENTWAESMRSVGDSNAVSVLSKIWDTNRLNFDKKWRDLNEWRYDVTSFIDEYWESVIDIPLLLYSWWTSGLLSTARKWVSLSRNGSRLVRLWTTARETTMWKKLITLWNYMQDMSATVHSSKFMKYLDGLSSATMPSRNKMLLWAWDIAELERDWAKLDAFLNTTAKSVGKQTTLWDFWREVFDGMIQDRIIANFLLGKMDTDYTEWDVWTDVILTTWLAPFTNQIVWLFWMSNKGKQAKALLDFVAWWTSVKQNREIIEYTIKNFGLVEWTDYMKLSDGKLVPANNKTVQKFLDATKIANSSVNIWNKMILNNPAEASRTLAYYLNEASFVDMVKNQRSTNLVGRTDVENYLQALKSELDIVNNGWSEASILAKYFQINTSEKNTFKTPNSISIIWWNDTPMLKSATTTDIKTIFWITDEELEAGITQAMIDAKSAENWVDYTQVFSRTEITNPDWTTETVYKYWWFNNTEIWFNNATDWWLEALIDWLPEAGKQDVAIVSKLAQDLDNELNC